MDNQEPSSLGTGDRSSLAESCPEDGVAGARARIQETDLGFSSAAVTYRLYDLGKSLCAPEPRFPCVASGDELALRVIVRVK